MSSRYEPAQGLLFLGWFALTKEILPAASALLQYVNTRKQGPAKKSAEMNKSKYGSRCTNDCQTTNS
jgi:hypothetical protein